MFSKELHLDMSSMNAIFAGDIVRNINILEENFQVRTSFWGSAESALTPESLLNYDCLNSTSNQSISIN